jgi:hypothetical protein
MSMPSGARSADPEPSGSPAEILTIRAALTPVHRTFTLKDGREYEARYGRPMLLRIRGRRLAGSGSSHLGAINGTTQRIVSCQMRKRFRIYDQSAVSKLPSY